MKKLTTYLVISALLLALTAVFCIAAAEDKTEYKCSDYKYTVNEDGTATITRYTGNAEALEIPNMLDGKTVTVIGEEAFYDCDDLKNVTIPESVTSIGDMVFCHCSRHYTITKHTIHTND